MKTLTHPRPENDNPIDDVGAASTPPKSILPDDERGISSIMVGINGRTDRRFYAPAVSSFWRPPLSTRVALARGQEKIRRSEEADAGRKEGPYSKSRGRWGWRSRSKARRRSS